jgi:transcriptional regulator with XRE-family HTH domain
MFAKVNNKMKKCVKNLLIRCLVSMFVCLKKKNMTEKENVELITSKNKEILATLKTQIRKLREAAGHSQESMSKLMGMSPSGFAKIEAGENDITVSRLGQIASILKVPLADLLAQQQPNTGSYHTQAQQIMSVVNGTNYGSIHPEENNRQLIEALQSRLEKLESSLGG